MLLSIVMMVKNEEKYLEKTLNALDGLRKEIDSELVVLDTGSSDKTIEIAKKYTNKVYSETWKDNFAKMRNKSIEYVSGEWILILDADEELINYEKIIDFFNSKLCKSYNSASIELKSILDKNGEVYTKASIPRLFRKTKKFKYVGAIHEQPLLEEPMYKDIAYFNHYGYMYENEEIKLKKVKRNEKILLNEYKKDPNNPYICYQLGKNYSAFGEYKEALHFMKKSYDIYRKRNIPYIPTESSLARIYLKLEEYEKCKKLCMNYINRDDKNIDIYFYLILAQKNLKQYNEALKSYDKYVYLNENYEISTQASKVISLYETASMSENIKFDIIDIYYTLEKYEELLNLVNKIDEKNLRNIYFIIFSCLYELGREKEIIDIYKYNKYKDSFVEEQSLKISLEKLIINLKKSDRNRIYSIAEEIEGNYGILNEVRNGKKILELEYNQILIIENEEFYGDLIYYALEDNINIINILKGVNQIQKNKYVEYLIEVRRECIIKLYNYLLEQKNTLDIEIVGTYCIISKALLQKGNLKDDKFENLIYMNIAYHYEYLKQLYNENLTDENILRFTSNEEDLFVINIIIANKLKRNNKLEYIKILKEILVKNYRYKDIIDVLINKFTMELNESKEMKRLKIDYKNLIRTNINNGNLEEVSKMIIEYESLHKDDYEVLNMKAILEILNGNFNEADLYLKKSLLLDYNNIDTLFNIAYLKELMGENQESIRFYNKIINIADNENIIKDAQEKIKGLCNYR